MKKLVQSAGLAGLLVISGYATKAVAGTQDFTLVNKTGVDIHNLYVSESAKDSWEEDILGEDQVIENGDSLAITFKGKKACKWDLMVKSEEGGSVYWRGIDLCTVSTVVLKCNKKECVAEFE